MVTFRKFCIQIFTYLSHWGRSCLFRIAFNTQHEAKRRTLDEFSGGAVPAYQRRPIVTDFISKEVAGSKGLSRHVVSEMSKRETTPRDTC